MPVQRNDTCAVILTHYEITRRGSARSDATPDDYRRNGLRTSGSWTGSGESLDSISLSAGLLVNSTQTGTQEMAYDIVSSACGLPYSPQGPRREPIANKTDSAISVPALTKSIHSLSWFRFLQYAVRMRLDQFTTQHRHGLARNKYAVPDTTRVNEPASRRRLKSNKVILTQSLLPERT